MTGKPVELTVTPVSSQAVRITIQPIEDGRLKPIPKDGALVNEDFGKRAASIRSVAGFPTVMCGDPNATVSADPTAIRIEGRETRVIQELRVDADDSAPGCFSEAKRYTRSRTPFERRERHV